MIDPLDPTRRRTFADDAGYEDLLVPVFRGGQRVYDLPSMDTIRARREAQLGHFHAGVKRFANPHRWPVGLEQGLHDLKTRLILRARGEEA
jgi:nicotinate phosphoribosyltransferase